MIHYIYSTLPGFKKIQFKPGLNVLLSEKTPKATNKNTRNRAGKTSLIELIHFLMGSNADKDSIFRGEILKDFIFGMEFDLKNLRTRVNRSGKNVSELDITHFPDKNSIILNKDWIDILGQKMFGLNSLQKEGSKPPSFRSLFAYFVRRQLSGAFSTPEKAATMQQIGDIQTSLMFLLGLDWHIARDWQIVREKEKVLKQLKKAGAENILGNVIGKKSDLRTQLTIEKARLQKRQEEIKNFRTHPQYHELESEADQLTQSLNQLVNENTIDLAFIRDLEKALMTESPPQMEDLLMVYQEAGITLPGMVKRRYDDVKNFHESIIRNRQDYLSEELGAARFRIQGRELEIKRMDERRAQIMEILQNHGALEHFNQLQKEVARLESQVESIRHRFEVAEKLQHTQSELEVERNRLRMRLGRNFFEQKDRLDQAILAFEEVSQRLYESAGSMTIAETANGPVFKFPMQGSRSKGIKNMQIFCFDMMLMFLCAQQGWGPGFLVHDSHLFDGVDGRQVIRALRAGAEAAKVLGFQYIVTMNEDDAFKENEQGFNLNDYVLPMRLTDATEEGGLFGIRFE